MADEETIDDDATDSTDNDATEPPTTDNIPTGPLSQFRPTGTRDTRLIERAIRNGWPITDEMRAAVVKRMGGIVKNNSTKRRDAIMASKVLIHADSLNAKREATDTEREIAEYREQRDAGLPPAGATIESLTVNNTQINNNPPPDDRERIEVIYDDNWYGNANKVAEAAASSVPRPKQLGPVQAADMRAAVDENRAVADRVDSGTR